MPRERNTPLFRLDYVSTRITVTLSRYDNRTFPEQPEGVSAMPQGTITVKNSDGADNFVTLFDNNLAGGPMIGGWNKHRLNATDPGQTGTATVELDGSGFCKVAWNAERTDGSASK